MRLSAVVIAFAAFGMLSAPAFAQSVDQAPKKKPVRVVATSRSSTVVRSRDEDGRVRTRIIIQRRSYLDPGTETLTGAENFTDYAVSPNQSRTGSGLDQTIYGQYQIGPHPFDLPAKNVLFGW